MGLSATKIQQPEGLVTAERHVLDNQPNHRANKNYFS